MIYARAILLIGLGFRHAIEAASPLPSSPSMVVGPAFPVVLVRRKGPGEVLVVITIPYAMLKGPRGVAVAGKCVIRPTSAANCNAASGMLILIQRIDGLPWTANCSHSPYLGHRP